MAPLCSVNFSAAFSVMTAGEEAANQKLYCVTTVLQPHRRKPTFCPKFGAMATRASGLKILVSVVRFRPWAMLQQRVS